MTIRTVQQTVKGRPAIDGAGVHLVRVLGGPTVHSFDPFVMLDAFDSKNPSDYIAGFPMHPHRGIETVTYLMQGSMKHEDSLGNKGEIKDGCCQWMTAGSGIMHQEMPQNSPRMLGLQLWVNLPAADKMVNPKYHGLEADEIPVVKEEHAEVKVLCGRYNGTGGAMQADYVPVTFLDVQVAPGAQWTWQVEKENTVFLYVFSGEVYSGGSPSALPKQEAVLFTPGDTLSLRAGKEGARFVALSGKPLHEPVAWGGPIVMNTEQELQKAYYELESGTFIKHSPSDS